MMYSFVLREERITQTRFGMRTSVVSLGESGGPDEFTKTSAFTSSGGDAVVVERRRLVGDGHAHIQVRRGTSCSVVLWPHTPRRELIAMQWPIMLLTFFDVTGLSNDTNLLHL